MRAERRKVFIAGRVDVERGRERADPGTWSAEHGNQSLATIGIRSIRPAKPFFFASRMIALRVAGTVRNHKDFSASLSLHGKEGTDRLTLYA
jgi:hypothetical protein